MKKCKWYSMSHTLALNCFAPLFLLTLGCTGVVGQASDASDTGSKPKSSASGGAGGAATSTPLGGQDAVGNDLTLDCDASAYPKTQIWKLTTRQLINSFAALGVPADKLRLPFGSTSATPFAFANKADSLDLSDLVFENLFDTATANAPALAASWRGRAPCLAQAKPTTQCLQSEIRTFGRRALRKTLDDAAVNRFVDLFAEEAAAPTASAPLEQVVAAMLTSPDFLFRSELGSTDAVNGVVTLTPQETASALSYSLTDGPPDELLTKAADAGELATAAQVDRQVARLMAEPTHLGVVERFFQEWLGYGRAAEISKDAKVFPRFGREVGASMVLATNLLVRDLYRKDQGYRSFMSTRTIFTNNALASFLGEPMASTDEFREVKTNQQLRVGLLTQPSVMTVEATLSDSDIVKRGRLVRQQIFCHDLPAPPPNIPPLKPTEPGVSNRQRIQEHSENPACRTCHRLMDPIGFGFENYDGAGRFRASSDLIQTSGKIEFTASTDGDFSGIEGLTGALAESPDTAGCFVRQAFRFVYGRLENRSDGCELLKTSRSFVDSQPPVSSLFRGLVAAEHFRKRTAVDNEGKRL